MTDSGIPIALKAASASRKTLRKLLQALGGLVLGALAIVYLQQGGGLDNAWLALRRASPVWILVAVTLVALTQAAKVYRWNQILDTSAHALGGSGQLWRGLLIGQALNLLIPVRLGDVARAVVVGRGTVGSIYTFYTIVVEKAWEAGMLLICLALISACGPWVKWLSVGGVSTAGLLLIVVGLGLGGVYWRRQSLSEWVERTNGRRRAWLERLVNPAVTLAGSLAKAARDGRLLGMAMASVMIWGLGAATNDAVFAALGIAVHWSAALFVLVGMYAGVAVPSPPARVGVFELLVVLVLSAYGIGREEALACGILLHLVVIGPLLLAAAAALLVEGGHAPKRIGASAAASGIPPRDA